MSHRSRENVFFKLWYITRKPHSFGGKFREVLSNRKRIDHFKEWTKEEIEKFVMLVREHGCNYLKIIKQFNEKTKHQIWSKMNYLKNIGHNIDPEYKEIVEILNSPILNQFTEDEDQSLI